MKLLRTPIRAAALGLALCAMGLSACREVQQLRPPDYCRYSQIGPLCSEFDSTQIPFAAELGLRALDSLHPFDRPIIVAHAATLTPRPRSLLVLAPIGPIPPGRSPVEREMPQPFHRHGNPRLAMMALETAPGRVDVHAFILIEDRVASTRLLARGLRAATLRGLARNGMFRLGFSLADDPASLGDRFALRSRQPNGQGSRPPEAWVANLDWQRIGAGTSGRKIHYFESIVNSGSCAGSGAAPLLLGPVPRAWLDEYVANCPVRPATPEFRLRPKADMIG